MEVKRHIIHDTRLGLWVTSPSFERAESGAAAMNHTAGYTRFVARTIIEFR